MYFLLRSLYPNLDDIEYKKFRLLGVVFFLLIGTYWLLRLLKQAIFFKVAFPVSLGWWPDAGADLQPTAKKWSVFIVLLLVLVYSKLVDKFKRHQLFYILCTFYASIFLAVGLVIFVSEVYGPRAVGRDLLALTGWVSYYAIESFGSLIVALFWAFTNSITDNEKAKEGFPLVVGLGQIGAIIGSSMLILSPYIGVFWPLLFGSSILVALVIPLIRHFINTTPKEHLVGYKAAAKSNDQKEGPIKSFFSGLILLLTRPYLFGILVISTFYELVSQIVEYQMNKQAGKIFHSDTLFAQFEGFYGVCINSLSLLIALLGTRYILQRLGVRIGLLIYPVSFALLITGLMIYYTYGAPAAMNLLLVTFIAMVLVKALGYAVNNPTKEMMYIPTSKNAKFKTKSWIDTFGARFAKAGGASINDVLKGNMHDLVVYGNLFGLLFIFVWIFVAIYVGIKNRKLVAEGKVVD